MNLEQLRAFCLSLPAVKEDVKWENDLCFCVGDKMFCVTGLNRDFAATFKAADEEFETLIEREGISPAPYLARAKWVAVSGGEFLNEKEWGYFIEKSYQLVKDKLTKKVKTELGIV